MILKNVNTTVDESHSYQSIERDRHIVIEFMVVMGISFCSHFSDNENDGEVSKVENVTVEMMCGVDQLIERKEDRGTDKTYYDLRDMYGGHAEIGESSLIGYELVQETTDKVVLITEKLKAARDRQKIYVANMLLDGCKYARALGKNSG
nr:putative reverse transcriptase domain-containing protein [Tanacetum cinerariifolium]